MHDDRLITRRATVDDLPQLVQLWNAFFFPADVFEKRLTEFHLVEDPKSKFILAVIGIRLQNGAVMIHSEAFGDPNNHDLYRDMLWPRFQTLARNFGVSKIWTQERAGFWVKEGFRLAPEKMLTARPNFPDSEEHLPWLFVQLFDEEKVADAMSGEKFAEFVRQQHDETETFARQLRILRNVVIVLGIAVMGTILIMFLLNFASAHPGLGH